MGITMTVPVRIVQFDPPTSITWQGQRFGINASHTYRFTPYCEGTLLSNEEKFSGARFPLRKLIAAWYRMTNLSQESLEGIERELLRSTPR
jgi:hypothetical protein